MGWTAARRLGRAEARAPRTVTQPARNLDSKPLLICDEVTEVAVGPEQAVLSPMQKAQTPVEPLKAKDEQQGFRQAADQSSRLVSVRNHSPVGQMSLRCTYVEVCRLDVSKAGE